MCKLILLVFDLIPYVFLVTLKLYLEKCYINEMTKLDTAAHTASLTVVFITLYRYICGTNQYSCI